MILVYQHMKRVRVTCCGPVIAFDQMHNSIRGIIIELLTETIIIELHSAASGEYHRSYESF